MDQAYQIRKWLVVENLVKKCYNKCLNIEWRHSFSFKKSGLRTFLQNVEYRIYIEKKRKEIIHLNILDTIERKVA